MRAHLVKRDAVASGCELQGGFGAGEAAAYDSDMLHMMMMARRQLDMRFGRMLAHFADVLSTLALAFVVMLIMTLDAPFFSLLDPHLRVLFLVAFALAILATTFASRWWIILVALWIPPASFSVFVFFH
jgi:hypothetical protein